MAARQYSRRRLDSVALMKTMGARQGQILKMTLLQLLLLAGITGVAGGILGYLSQHGRMFLLSDIIRTELPWPSLKARRELRSPVRA